jgi:ABC-2 type transport system permease protein
MGARPSPTPRRRGGGQVGLEDAAEAHAGWLSLGMARRLALARAFVVEPADRARGGRVRPPWLPCFLGILEREGLRFVRQRERFFAALVRPLVWLFVFAAGFRSVLGVSIQPPYETYVLYEVYITPGLAAMILLFAGMQSSLAMVYDREMGSMRVLLVSPLPRWGLLTMRLLAAVLVAALQVYAFLAIAWLWEVRPPALGYDPQKGFVATTGKGE